MKGILSTIALSLTTLSFGQSINLSGKIVIDYQEDYSLIHQINVINKQTEKIVKPDDIGDFTIEVQLNDELVFTSSFTEKRVIKVTESIIKKGFITVHLDLETIELAEANINPLKKNLKDNISKEKSQQEKMYELIGFNEEFKLDMIKYRLALAYIKKNNGVTSYENVLRIKDQFFKDAKSYQSSSLRRLANNKALKFDQILTIKSFLNPSYFTNQLKISETNIDEFINFCFDKYDFEKLLKKENYDQIMFYLSEEAPRYLALLNN